MDRNWNIWTQETVELASSAYLDRLSSIYPAESGDPRPLKEEEKRCLQELYSQYEMNSVVDSTKAGMELLEFLFLLKGKYKRFALEHPYVAMLEDEEVRRRNPEVCMKLLREIKKIGLTRLIENLEKPADINRTLGNSFKKYAQSKLPLLLEERAVQVSTMWLKDKKAPQVADLFDSTIGNTNCRVTIFLGSDKKLKEKVLELLTVRGSDIVLETKGLDFVFLLSNGWLIFGEAKFQSDTGGNQDNQKIIGGKVLSVDAERKLLGAFVIDGMPVIEKFSGWSLEPNKVVLSALLLPDLVEKVCKEGELAIFRGGPE